MRRLMLLVSLSLGAASLPAQSYEITHTYNVGGEGSWDYVIPDAPNHRLFIGRQNRVMVIDMNNGKLIAEVTGINGAHGVALAPATGHGFATSGNDSSVVMFDSRPTRRSAEFRRRKTRMRSSTIRRQSASSPSTATRTLRP